MIQFKKTPEYILFMEALELAMFRAVDVKEMLTDNPDIESEGTEALDVANKLEGIWAGFMTGDPMDRSQIDDIFKTGKTV